MDLFTIAHDGQRAADVLAAMERHRLGMVPYESAWYVNDMLRGTDAGFTELCMRPFARPVEAIEAAAEYLDALDAKESQK